ncbi:MAG: molybdate ABC transporter substrate-binding protein [Myxococcota bacterium]
MRALAAILLALVGLARAGEPAPVTVFAAASLTDALPKAAAAWTARGNPRVVFGFDASSRLAKQIEAGAPADAYFSADVAWMDHLDRRGLVTARVDLLGNQLVAVVRPGSPVRAPTDLAGPAVKHLGLAGEAVPAGRYARAALAHHGVWDRVKDRVVTGDDVRTVLGWVAAGEAEAGIVYATDARVEPRVAVAFVFAPDSHPPVVYPAAVVKGAARAEEAAAFLAYCASAEGRRIFEAEGFTAR